MRESPGAGHAIGASHPAPKGCLLRLKPGQRKGVTAQCHMIPDGTTARYIVLTGSEAVASEGLHLSRSGRKVMELRQKLIQEGVLRPVGGHLEFTRDHDFPDPSVAAGVVLGRTANGYICWEDDQGRLLDEFRTTKKRVSRKKRSTSE